MSILSNRHRAPLLALALLTPAASRAADPATEAAPAATPDPTAEVPLASDLPADSAPPVAAPTTNVTINLINRLVQKGILTQAEAAEIIQQAQADATAAAARADLPPIPPEPTPAEEMRVTYIPEVVRNQMRDEIKQDLMIQAREEEWSKKVPPSWTSKFRPFGDLRVRSDNTFFPDGNDTSGSFPNFNAINTGSPYDETSANYASQYNVDQDRYRTRLRARIGTEILLGDGFNGGLRLATGDSNGPTSTNQSLGGSGGSFSKYSIWLDRAFLGYTFGPGDGDEATLFVGRFDNPFFTSEIQWDEDIGFDGLALHGKARLNDNLSTFLTAGYFPVYNTDFNFASNQPTKFDSTDKWLTGVQLGIDWKVAKDLTAKVGVAYYDFDSIAGELSSPFIPLSDKDAGDTDTTRPSFAQRGNSYMRLRNINNTTFANDYGNKYQYQYYGLASEFRNLTLTGRLDYDHYDPIRLSLLGEVTKNLAFDSNDVAGRAVNNFGPGTNGAYDGGDMAWYLSFIIGNPALEKFGDWQASIGYRYVESDAVVDGFTDSDFGGGGTNVQGFTLGANFALTKDVRCGLRWMSSDEIAGPPLASDVLMIDLNAKF
jgi:hypothetical protein